MPDLFDQFPNWDDPAYRRYWLRHNLNQDLFSEYSGADIWRALASEGRYVSQNMLYDARQYALSMDERVDEFNSLRGDETIPYGHHEYEPYWAMTSDYMYTVEMVSYDDEGNAVFTTRAIGSNRQLTPDELFATADYYFGVDGNSEPIEFESIFISHAYRR